MKRTHPLSIVLLGAWIAGILPIVMALALVSACGSGTSGGGSTSGGSSSTVAASSGTGGMGGTGKPACLDATCPADHCPCDDLATSSAASGVGGCNYPIKPCYPDGIVGACPPGVCELGEDTHVLCNPLAPCLCNGCNMGLCSTADDCAASAECRSYDCIDGSCAYWIEENAPVTCEPKTCMSSFGCIKTNYCFTLCDSGICRQHEP